jgi:hypothetical protein
MPALDCDRQLKSIVQRRLSPVPLQALALVIMRLAVVAYLNMATPLLGPCPKAAELAVQPLVPA